MIHVLDERIEKLTRAVPRSTRVKHQARHVCFAQKHSSEACPIHCLPRSSSFDVHHTHNGILVYNFAATLPKMAGFSKTPNGTPAPPPSLKKSTSSSKNQTSIAGFFKKASMQPSANGTARPNSAILPVNGLSKMSGTKNSTRGSSQSLTPAPSSDAAQAPHDEIVQPESVEVNGKGPSNSLPSPVTPSSVAAVENQVDVRAPKGFYSPSRKVRFRGLLTNYSN